MNFVGLVQSSFIFDSSNLSPIHGIQFMESRHSLTNHSVLCCGQCVFKRTISYTQSSLPIQYFRDLQIV